MFNKKEECFWDENVNQQTMHRSLTSKLFELWLRENFGGDDFGLSLTCWHLKYFLILKHIYKEKNC